MASTRASLGLRRISAGTPRSAAAATRDTRRQFQQIVANLDRILDSVVDLTPDALVAGLKPIFDVSQDLVPVDKGNLKKSGFLETGTFRGNPVAVIGYGRGNNPEYTIFVHEDLDASHKSPTQAKFLQQPFQEQFNDILSRVQRFLKGSLGT